MKMSTKLQKRKTRQIRVGQKTHIRLKLLAVKKGITMSKLLDKIIAFFLARSP